MALNAGEGAQRSEFGLFAGIEVQTNTNLRSGAIVVAIVIERRSVVDDGVLEADVTADLQAGLGARDVEEAGAVDVADADVVDRIRRDRYDDVRSAGAGNCDEGRSGAEKKALDVHVLTSSQVIG